MLECVAVDAQWIFELFTRGNQETEVFLLDLRPYKFFKRQHIQQSFCIRLTADKEALAVRKMVTNGVESLKMCNEGLLEVTV